MAVHWTVQFSADRSGTYTVNIYDDNYSGSAIPLTGGASPFVTEEDNDDDWFRPVRTQSGYLNIVDTGKDNNGNTFDWRNLFPQTAKSRLVKLVDSNGYVKWQGWLQPQSFSGQLYEPTQERSFPLMCSLSALNGVTVTTTNQGVVTFAWLINYLLAQSGHDYTYICFQGGDSKYWLNKKVDWNNFIETDESGNKVGKYNCLELLEEVCKFWGWTCRTYGDSIYFVAADDPDMDGMIQFDEEEWHRLYTGGAASPESIDYGTVDIDDDVYASTRNTVEYMRGVRRVSVFADINKQDVVTDIPYSKIAEIYKGRTVSSSTYGTDGHIFTQHSYENNCVYTFGDMKITMYPHNYTSSTGSCFLIREYYEGNLTYKHNYDFDTSLALIGDVSSTQPEMEYLVRIQSQAPHSYDHGAFVISGNVRNVYIDSGAKKEYNGNGKLTCRLGIGDYWWNGSLWSNSFATPPTFDINVGDEESGYHEGVGAIICNRLLDGVDGPYDGWGVPIVNPRGGFIDFQIVGYARQMQPGMYDLAEVLISDLKLSFVRQKTYAEYADRDRNSYIYNTGTVFTGEYETTTIFATDNGNAFGFGIVMDDDGSYCTGVSYDYGAYTDRPEDHLAQRIRDKLSDITRKESVELRSDAVTLTRTKFVETSAVTGYAVSISRDWRDDVTRAVIMEV